MRHISFLLALASLAAALPLKKGRTWAWRVTNPSAGSVGWITAKVLDSTRHDSGAVWRLQVRDSASGTQDTAKLLAYKDGRQNWISLSGLLPWDPTPYTPKDSIRLANPLIDTITWPWGGGFCGVRTNLQGVGWSSWSSRLSAPASDGWRVYSCEVAPASSETRFPMENWNPETDYVRGQLLPDFDWLLVEKDGAAFSTAANDTFPMPVPGDSLVWSLINDQYSASSGNLGGSSSQTWRETISWIFLGGRRDSAGWRIVPVRQSIAGTFETSSSSTLSPIGSQTTSYLLVQQRTGLILTGSSSLDAQIASGWQFAWSDSSVVGGRYRSTSTSSSNSCESSSTTTSSLFRLDGTLEAFNEDGGSSTSCMYPSSSSIYIFYHLLSVNGIVDGVRVRQAPRAGVHTSLPELASLHPSLPVRWRDVRGRTGQIPASSLLHGHAASGLLFLDATLPDGSPWSGTWMATRR